MCLFTKLHIYLNMKDALYPILLDLLLYRYHLWYMSLMIIKKIHGPNEP